MRPNLILHVIAKLLIPLIILFALYVQFHGDFGPGGGFQAGVIFSAALILYSLVFGLDAAEKIIPASWLHKLAALGVVMQQSDCRAASGDSTGGAGRGHHRCSRHVDPVFYLCRQGAGLMDFFIGHFNYWIVIFLMMVGLYTVISRGNLIKKIIGLNIFQVSVFFLYISLGTVAGGAAPIITEGVEIYSNPLPHVLILTAIVVGVSTTALALALVVRIKESYGTIEEDEIHNLDQSL
jgi:multicomponent Na+:H+ antiporter subunit C